MNLNRGQSMILAIMEPQWKLFNSKKKKMIQSLVDARVLLYRVFNCSSIALLADDLEAVPLDSDAVGNNADSS